MLIKLLVHATVSSQLEQTCDFVNKTLIGFQEKLFDSAIFREYDH